MNVGEVVMLKDHGIISLNEARKLLGLDKRDAKDELVRALKLTQQALAILNTEKP